MRFLFSILFSLIFLGAYSQSDQIEKLMRMTDTPEVPRYELIKYADSLLANTNDQLLKFECLYCKGLAYEDMGMFENSQKFYKQAMILAVESSNSDILMQAHLGLGNMYLHRDMLIEAETNFRQLLHLSNKSGKFHAQITANTSMGLLMKNMHKIDSAFYYVRKVIFMVESNKNRSHVGDQILQVNYNTIAKLFLEDQEIDSAFYYASKAEDLYQQTKLIDGRIAALGTIAKCFVKKTEIKKAEETYLEILNLIEKFELTEKFVDAYEEISVFYERKGDVVNALKYSRLYEQKKVFIDSLGNENRLFEINQIHEKDIGELKLKLASEKLKVLEEESRRRILKYIILFMILGIIIIWLILIIRKRRLESIEVRRRMFEEKRKANKDRIIGELEKELMAKKIQWKNQRLSNYSIVASHKSELIDHISSKLKTLKKIDEINVIRQGIKEEISYLNDQLTIDRQELAMQSKVIEIEEDFYNKLKDTFPELTKMELELCGLMKLNLSIKEIAAIKNNTQETIKTARYRLRKKLKISDPNIGTSEFLAQFS
jgi:predicted nucleic acid-binding Zn ribbon protein